MESEHARRLPLNSGVVVWLLLATGGQQLHTYVYIFTVNQISYFPTDCEKRLM